MNIFASYLKSNVLNTLFLEKTNHRKVTDICEGICPGTAAGYDNVY